jgi:hypothetical protein
MRDITGNTTGKDKLEKTNRILTEGSPSLENLDVSKFLGQDRDAIAPTGSAPAPVPNQGLVKPASYPPDAGMVWDGEWRDARDWGKLSEREIIRRLELVGLKHKPGGLYHDYIDIDTDAPVEWTEAHLRITGSPLLAPRGRNTTKEVSANVN